MQPIKKFLEANFRIKVLVPVVAVMILLLLVMVLIVNLQFKHQAEQSASREMRAVEMYFHDELVRHQKNLRLRFNSLASEPRYRALFFNTDAKTIYDSLRRMMQDEGPAGENIEFVFFRPTEAMTPEENESMLYQRSQAAPTRAILNGSAAAVKLALQGEAAADTIQINQKLYELVSIPIYTPERDHLLGALTFGEEINGKVMQEFSPGIHRQAVLIASNAVIASTFNDAEGTELMVERFNDLNAHFTPTQPVLARLIIGSHYYFCTSGRFPSINNDGSLGYLLFSSYDEQIALLGQTRQLLLVAIVIGILFGSGLVLFFINKATQPLRDLHDAAEAVGRGDFSHRVNVRTQDEFGELAHAFNQMTENIELSQSKLKQTVETLKTTQGQLIQSEKLSAVGEFVAGVAHELNNPLAAVMGFSEMLKDADVGEQHRRHLDMIFKSAERCKKIVQSLLSFARRQAPERKPVTVNKLIEDVLEMVAYPLRTSNVKVITHFSQKLPLVLADGHQVQQVVLNMINNARQAIEAHQDSGSITITTSENAGTVRIAIQDSGPGISPENLKRIFDPFFTTKDVGQGTGLGLSLCYGIIHEHGGNIIPSSKPGEGATFTIELPAADESTWSGITSTATSSAPKSDLCEGAGKTILVVDDEESLLHMMKEELKRHSYEVKTATNGETALRKMGEQKFDLIVCDIKMPGLNGRQVYERLRAESPETCRRMVFITGDIIGSPLRDFLETEKRPIIAKPFSLGELRQTIKTTLAQL
jgi:signal transduction histidine kinase